MRIAVGILAIAFGVMVGVGCDDTPTSAPVTNDGQNQAPVTGTDTTNEPVPGTPAARALAFEATRMSGLHEVPANNSLGGGSLRIHLTDDGETLVYSLIVTNLDQVTAAHIHIGGPGEVGAPVVTLYQGPATREANGLLRQWVITPDMLQGSLAGRTVAELMSLMAGGRTYVNVHTTRYPDGEIRDQIRSVPPEEEPGGGA